MMDKVMEQAQWAVERERKLRKRLRSTPPEISDEYALLRAVVLFGHRDLVQKLPEEYRPLVEEFDANWYNALGEAEKTFYRLGFADAREMDSKSPDP